MAAVPRSVGSGLKPYGAVQSSYHLCLALPMEDRMRRAPGFALRIKLGFAMGLRRDHYYKSIEMEKR